MNSLKVIAGGAVIRSPSVVSGEKTPRGRERLSPVYIESVTGSPMSAGSSRAERGISRQAAAAAMHSPPAVSQAT